MTGGGLQDPSQEDALGLLGAEIGGYRLVALIGRGGMGHVYGGHAADGRRVAVKILSPTLAWSQEFRDRFLIEATVTIDHPNVVPIDDAGEADGLLYLTMPLVDGIDLKELIVREGPLSLTRAVDIFRQIADALDAAHENGLVHRDIKPQNVLIDRSDEGRDRVLLTDFGLVKRASVDSSLTSTGTLVGTAPYVSPEQISGRAVTGRADVYSLGCVLYECLTGEVPFRRDDEIAVLFAHMNDAPPLVSEVRPELPAAVDEVVSVALAKSPDERFLTAGEMAAALREAAAPSSPLPARVWNGPARKPATPSRSARRNVQKRRPVVVPGLAWAAAGAALVLAISVIPNRDQNVSVIGDSGSALIEESIANPSANSRPASTIGGETSHAGGRTGSRGKKERASKAVGGPASVVDQPPAGGPSAGSPARVGVLADRTGLPPPTGSIVFHALGPPFAGAAIYEVRPDGSGIRVFHDSSEEDLDPTWAPNKDRIAFVRDTSLVVATRDGDLTQVAFGPGQIRNPAWSPDGRSIAYSYLAPGSDSWDIYVARAEQESVRLGRQLTSGPASDRDPEWSPDGETIAFTSTRGNSRTGIYLMAQDGSDIHALPGQTGAASAHPAWSANGSRIAYVNETRSPVIMIRHLARGTQDAIVCRLSCTRPSWSPDGRYIVYSGRGQDGQTNLLLLNLERPERQVAIVEDVDDTARGAWR